MDSWISGLLLYRDAFCNFGKDGRNNNFDFYYKSDHSDHNGPKIIMLNRDLNVFNREGTS